MILLPKKRPTQTPVLSDMGDSSQNRSNHRPGIQDIRILVPLWSSWSDTRELSLDLSFLSWFLRSYLAHWFLGIILYMRIYIYTFALCYSKSFAPTKEHVGNDTWTQIFRQSGYFWSLNYLNIPLNFPYNLPKC